MDGTREQRREAGRALRAQVPRSAHAEFTPAHDRIEPFEILEEQAATRVDELIPIRYERMLTSPFAFFRGSAAVMAMDLARTPRTGLTVQACGDAHVSNFGEFATPERNVVFDVNDFDETLPGPWEWDVKRLAASLALVGRERGFSAKSCDGVVATAVREYREQMAGYADLRMRDLWYARIEIDEVIGHFPPKYRQLVERDVAKARRKTSRRAVAKLTEVLDGKLRFVEDPPLVVRLENTEHDMDEVIGLIGAYVMSLSEDRRHLFERYRVVDVARKVVGVGSVGTRCWIGLFEGPDHPDGELLMLQVKEAQASVLERYLEPSTLSHHGLRVVAGQRITQAASDLFLGWSEGPVSGRHYYVRQLWDVKGAGDPARMNRTNLTHYGALCGWALARAHARTGDAVAISAYLGSGSAIDRAITRFATRYAEQAIADHAAVARAVHEAGITA
jgi:uncharacterized protein (DUF2252 family)